MAHVHFLQISGTTRVVTSLPSFARQQVRPHMFFLGHVVHVRSSR